MRAVEFVKKSTSGLGPQASGSGILGFFLKPEARSLRPSRKVHKLVVPLCLAVLKSDAISVRGGKALFCHSLNEPQQGKMAMRLAFGDGAEWCTAAPAKTSGTPPVAGKNDTVDRFTGAPKTPPAASCMLAPRAPL